MSSLQIALLLLGVGIAVMLVVSSRREKKAAARAAMPAPAPASRDWSESEEAPRPTAFDEFGVGKPRKRVAPDLLGDPTVEAPVTPASVSAAPTAPPAGAAPARVIGFYIAEYEGTNILGPKIHAALKAQNLSFGAKRIYHRLENGQPVFSVASLVKPGALDPSEAEGYATPGLSVFMALPGPHRPLAAFQDMLATSRALAKALNAELYDSQERAPLTPERERALHLQVEEWARRSGA